MFSVVAVVEVIDLRCEGFLHGCLYLGLFGGWVWLIDSLFPLVTLGLVCCFWGLIDYDVFIKV